MIPRGASVPLLGSSCRFSASPKIAKAHGPFDKFILGPPAGAPRQQICVFYCVLQLKLALRAPKLERERYFSNRFPRGLLGLFWPRTWPLGPLGCLDLQLSNITVFCESNWPAGLHNSSGSATFQTRSRCQCCFRVRGGSIEQSRKPNQIRIHKISALPRTSQLLGSIR